MILGYHPTVSRYSDDLVEIEGLVVDKIIVSEKVTKNTGTSDGYYSSMQLLGAVSVTKYLILLEYVNGKELTLVDPYRVKKVFFN